MTTWLGNNWFFVLGLLVMPPCGWYLGRPWQLAAPLGLAMLLVWCAPLLPPGWSSLTVGGAGVLMIVVLAPLVAHRWRRARSES